MKRIKGRYGSVSRVHRQPGCRRRDSKTRTAFAITPQDRCLPFHHLGGTSGTVSTITGFGRPVPEAVVAGRIPPQTPRGAAGRRRADAVHPRQESPAAAEAAAAARPLACGPRERVVLARGRLRRVRQHRVARKTRHRPLSTRDSKLALPVARKLPDAPRCRTMRPCRTSFLDHPCRSSRIACQDQSPETVQDDVMRVQGSHPAA